MKLAPLTLVAALLSVHPALAETRQVWESPAATVAQTVGITDLEITYHLPGVKGREIWGKLVPYGEVWRAGANDATTLSFSTPVKVAGKNVAAGKYALFMLPTKEKWTFILAKNPEQWGAYAYKPVEDVLRFDVTPAAAAPKEWLAFDIDLQGKNTAIVALHWDKLRGSFPIEVDVDGGFQAYLAAEVAKADGLKDEKERWNTYFTAAKYWIGRNEKLDEAGKLLDKSDKLGMNAWSYEYRARLLVKQGKVAQALPLLDKAKTAAAGKFPKEYLEGIDKLRAEWTAPKKK